MIISKYAFNAWMRNLRMNHKDWFEGDEDLNWNQFLDTIPVQKLRKYLESTVPYYVGKFDLQHSDVIFDDGKYGEYGKIICDYFCFMFGRKCFIISCTEECTVDWDDDLLSEKDLAIKQVIE